MPNAAFAEQPAMAKTVRCGLFHIAAMDAADYMSDDSAEAELCGD